MATVTAFIRVSTKKVDKANIRFRLRDGRHLQLFYKSNIEVNPAHWNPLTQGFKPKVVYDNDKKAEFNSSVSNMRGLILTTYNSIAGNPTITRLRDATGKYLKVKDKIDQLKEDKLFNSTDHEPLCKEAERLMNEIEPFRDPASDLLKTEIDKVLNPQLYVINTKPQSFIEAFSEFISEKKISEVRKSNYRVVLRALQRYELFKRSSGVKDFQLTFDGVNSKVLRDIEIFLAEEHKHFKKYPEIYEAVPETRDPAPRGQNTINGIFTKLRTLFIWANEAGKTANNPFKNFKIEECSYGTPFYITIDERNQLYKFDLSKRPQLAI